MLAQIGTIFQQILAQMHGPFLIGFISVVAIFACLFALLDSHHNMVWKVFVGMLTAGGLVMIAAAFIQQAMSAIG